MCTLTRTQDFGLVGRCSNDHGGGPPQHQFPSAHHNCPTAGIMLRAAAASSARAPGAKTADEITVPGPAKAANHVGGSGSGGAGEVARNNRNKPCIFFANGNCRKGASCNFSHESASEAGTIVKNKIPCKYFAKGNCRKGAYCNFSHESPKQPPISISGRCQEGCWQSPSPRPPQHYGMQNWNNVGACIQWGHEAKSYHAPPQLPPPEVPETRRCDMCLRHLPRKHFSNAQWVGNRANKKPGHRCKTCIKGHGVGAYIQFPIDDNDETFSKLQSGGSRIHSKEREEGTSPWDPSRALERMSISEPGSQRDLFGECAYRYILKKHPGADAGKVTGMLMEADEWELFQLLDDSKALDAKVREALRLLEAYHAGDKSND